MSSQASEKLSGKDDRSRNAKAQARHRAKRKAYVEQLEGRLARLQTATGISLENLDTITVPPTVKIRELEARNALLLDENKELRRRLSRYETQDGSLRLQFTTSHNLHFQEDPHLHSQTSPGPEHQAPEPDTFVTRHGIPEANPLAVPANPYPPPSTSEAGRRLQHRVSRPSISVSPPHPLDQSAYSLPAASQSRLLPSTHSNTYPIMLSGPNEHYAPDASVASSPLSPQSPMPSSTSGIQGYYPYTKRDEDSNYENFTPTQSTAIGQNSSYLFSPSYDNSSSQTHPWPVSYSEERRHSS